MSCPDRQPILTITTSKNWVLPPRPKNARKAKAVEKKKPKASPSTASPPGPDASLKTATLKTNTIKQASIKTKCATPAKIAPAPVARTQIDTPEDLICNIQAVDRENYHLKTKLLSLIHDYKHLKSVVMSTVSNESSPVPDLYDTATTARKRVFNEMGDPVNELISDLNDLKYTSPSAVVSPLEQEMDAIGDEQELFNFVNLDRATLDESDDELGPVADEDDDEDINSTSLSRMTSPSTSETDENSLMTSLTRSTTVSTTVSTGDKKPHSFFKFYELPKFSEDDYSFSFENIDPNEKLMSVIEEDHYNQVADFLEEKLLSNDVKYYESQTM